ncbi:siderophore iron transporter mirb [Apiospora kogelbergensis]|uniref:siderophore iron transporter mirb n=1 Tax=Apiospora kogelbergensis TaxID=1337665 RepID=UPI00312F76F0
MASPAGVVSSEPYDMEKRAAEYKAPPTHEVHEGADGKSESDGNSTHAQGVKRVEAITAVWSKKALWSTFVLLWLVSFVAAMLGSIEGALSPYITSSFDQHGLLAVINIAARIIGGVVTLSIGKLIDIRGRMEGFIGALLLITVGMIMKALCQNVETYAAAQVFYWVGNVALGFIIQVFVADITSLRNRMIIFTINSTPNLCTTFAGPVIAELFYYKANFRWAFASFLIILLVFSAPVVGVMWYHERKAKKLGLIRPESGRSRLESAKYYIIDFDVLGAILITAGFTLITLPFSLVSSANHSWQSASIIVMIVIGVVSLVAFLVWEKYFAPVQFFPLRTSQGPNRSWRSADVLPRVLVNLVVNGLSISISNYVLNAYSLTAYFTGPFIALFIRYNGHAKWPAMAAVPIYILGTALIIHFRVPGADVGYLTMCQVLVGFSTGMLTTMSELALMASVDHQNVAVAIAIYGLFGSVGSSIGYAIAGGIWTNILPGKLVEFLPDYAKDQAASIYGSIENQMAEPIGTPVRDAVIEAYGYVMRLMVIVGASLIPLLVIAVFIWKNINVKKNQSGEKKARGNIF